MKRIIPLLLLTLSASLACAESIIPVSCDEITRISIHQAKTSEPPVLTEEYPYVYPTTLWFKPEAAPKYHEFTDPNKIAVIKPDGTKIEYRPFLLLTLAGVVSGNTPYPTSVGSRQINIFFKTREGALEAAQKVCPKIKPEVFFVHDYLQKQRLKEKAILSDSVSCSSIGYSKNRDKLEQPCNIIFYGNNLSS